MSDILILAVSAGIFFFIVELFTGAFYGLSLSIASFAVAIYIYVSGNNDAHVVQAIIFLIFAGLSTFLAPKIFSSLSPDDEGVNLKNNYLDEHLGKIFVIKGKQGSFKIAIDGVDYLIHEDSLSDDFSE
jgi:membrane protein implicated in regulation of membrane protease activity